jgi:hypothetical protein
MRHIAICILMFVLVLTAIVSAETPATTPADQGPSVRQFMTPNGQVDINAIRSRGYQGPLDLKGIDIRVDCVGSAKVGHGWAFC